MLNNAEALLKIGEKHKIQFIGSGHAHTPRVWHHHNITAAVAPAVSFQWLFGTGTVKISKGFGFNVIELASQISIASCIY
ncbi:hypothetical protein ABLB84_07270 [Xenorhabdus szentirmaii]|uniref:hypothetical protein n=1 Tax=Xenorhabdus szentirmaii TaxID=290112 RepID=UPI0032B851AB